MTRGNVAPWHGYSRGRRRQFADEWIGYLQEMQNWEAA